MIQLGPGCFDMAGAQIPLGLSYRSLRFYSIDHLVPPIFVRYFTGELTSTRAWTPWHPLPDILRLIGELTNATQDTTPCGLDARIRISSNRHLFSVVATNTLNCKRPSRIANIHRIYRFPSSVHLNPEEIRALSALSSVAIGALSVTNDRILNRISLAFSWMTLHPIETANP